MNVSNPATAFWTSLQPQLLAAEIGNTAPVSLPAVPIQQRRRRGFDESISNGFAAVQLVKDDGVLRWVYEPPLARRIATRRSWRGTPSSPRDVVQRYDFPELGYNQITSALERVDLMLNRHRGLQRWERTPGTPFGGGEWRKINDAEIKGLRGRVLLLIHGTFSESRMFDSELLATPKENVPAEKTDGQRLWERWTNPKNGYAAVLAFDHATLSVAPWLNAIALMRELADSSVSLDILCHSRGGLVASWATQFGNLDINQIVFVGSPLMGTSLAAPNRLRDALDFLANVATAISATSLDFAAAIPPATPLALGVAGLSQALGRILKLGSATPLVDAAVGLVPGLYSQSRVANNIELKELSLATSKVKLRGVGVAFRPEEIESETWKFWKRFSNIGAQVGYYVGDMIFQQPNDLVVDFDSMNQLSAKNDLGVARRLEDHTDWKVLGPKSKTHHCSYFRDKDAIQTIGTWLS